LHKSGLHILAYSYFYCLADALDQIYCMVHIISLKVPKRENFSLAFFALSEHIWICELGTGEKNRIFYRLTPDFDGYCFLPHTEYAVNKKKLEDRPKLKVGGGCIGAHMCAHNVFLQNFEVLVIL
jgi:hypothetical protein